jgi:hypothetical protein
MSSRCVSKLPSCEDEERRRMECVYCHQRGPFVKNGVKMWGKHHVKFCCKTKSFASWNHPNPTFTVLLPSPPSEGDKREETGGWRRKHSLKNKNRVTRDAKIVLKTSCDVFSLLGAMEAKSENKRLKQETKKKLLKDAEMKKILAAAVAKKAPRPLVKKPVAFGGWLAVVKAKKKSKVEIPLVASPKRVGELKKQAFNKGAVMSFEEVKKVFTNTDNWGDSD